MRPTPRHAPQAAPAAESAAPACPPSIEAELSVLGAALQGALGQVAPLLRPEHFARPEHQRIFEAMLALHERGEPADLVTLSEELRRRKDLNAIGGDVYLTTLHDGVGTAANVAYHARIIRESALPRLVREAAQLATERFGQDGHEPAAVLQQLRDHLESLAAPETPDRGLLAEDAPAFLAGDVPPVTWRIEGIWPRGCSGFVAGPEKGGKSWVGLEMAAAMATGTAFLDRFPTVPATVLWAEEEDSVARIKRRLRKVLHGRGRPMPDPGRLWVAVRHGFSLVAPDGLAALRSEMEARRPDVCFLVNLREMTAGKDLLREADAGQVRDVLRGLVRDFGSDFVVLHHFRKAQPEQDRRGTQMLTGSGVWGAWAEAWLFLEPLDPEARTVLATAGSKDAEGAGRFLVTRRDTEDGQGTVLEYDGTPTTGRREKAQRAVLEALEATPGGTVQDLADALKASVRNVKRHLADLERAGFVSCQQPTVTTPKQWWPKGLKTDGEPPCQMEIGIAEAQRAVPL